MYLIVETNSDIVNIRCESTKITLLIDSLARYRLQRAQRHVEGWLESFRSSTDISKRLSHIHDSFLNCITNSNILFFQDT